MYIVSCLLILVGFLGCRYSPAQKYPEDLALDASDVFPVAFVMGCMMLLVKLAIVVLG